MTNKAHEAAGPRKASPSHSRHVALIVETSLGSGRGILAGVASYLRDHPGWSLFCEPRGLEDPVPRWLPSWKGDGLIVRVQNRQMAEAVLATRLPVVDVLGHVPEAGMPLVQVDDQEIARLAAEHLLEQGFQHFGYFGLRDEIWSVRRRDYFQSWLARTGHEANLCEVARHDRSEASWVERQNRLAQWIRSLPKPVGVMVCSDQRGIELLEACRRARVEVPQHLAVIGVNNDEILCELAHPPLSSIGPAFPQAGYQAAALLDRLMAGQHHPSAPILIGPSRVIPRQSTEAMAPPEPERNPPARSDRVAPSLPPPAWNRNRSGLRSFPKRRRSRLGPGTTPEGAG